MHVQCTCTCVLKYICNSKAGDHSITITKNSQSFLTETLYEALKPLIYHSHLHKVYDNGGIYI